MKKLLMLFLILLLPSLLFASPPSSSFTYSVGSIISPSEVQQNETNLYNYLTTGVDTFADGSIVNADISGSAAITYGKLSLGSSILSIDIKDGEITNADISSSAAIVDTKLAQITTANKVSSTAISGGVVLPSGALFYMITGSCPSGTTDVTATYSDKFIRINATQGSTGGSDTDSITLTTTELPAHTHTVATVNSFGEGTSAVTTSTNAPNATFTTSSAGSGSAFTVDTVPAYVTCKMCQVQ